MSQSGPHDEFLELCAASTSGELSEEEQKRLREHLAICAACREAVREYESIVNDVIPAIGASEHLNTCRPWRRVSQAEESGKSILRSLGEGREASTRRNRRKAWLHRLSHRILPFATESTWRNVWMLYAAGILLFALCFFAYWVGVRHGTDMAKAPQPQVNKQEPSPAQASLEEQLSDAAHDREVADRRSPIVTRPSRTCVDNCRGNP